MPHETRVDSCNDPLPTDAVLRIGTSQYRTGGDSHIAYAPDGKTFITLKPKIGVASLWDAGTCRRIRRYDLREEIGPGRVVHINGSMILWYGDDGLIAWDLAASRELGRIKQPLALQGTVGPRAAISSDGKWLIGVEELPGGDRSIRRWELATGSSDSVADIKSLPDVIAISNDGSVAAWAEYEGWQRQSVVHTVSATHGMHRFLSSSSARQLHLSPDGEVLFAFPFGLYRISGEPLPLEDGGGHFLDGQASFSPDGKYILVPTHDGLAVDNVSDGKRLQLFHDAHGAGALSPDGKTLISLGSTLRRWDLESGNPLDPDSESWGAYGPPNWLFFHAHAPKLVTGWAPGCEGEVRIWDSSSGKIVAEQQLFLNRFKYPAGDGQHVVATHPAIGRWQVIDVLTGETGPELQVLPQTTSSRLALVTHSLALEGGRVEIILRVVTFPDCVPKQVQAGGSHVCDGPVDLPLTVAIWDWRSQRLLEQHQLPFDLNWQDLLLSPDGRSAVSARQQVMLPTGHQLPSLEIAGPEVVFTPQVFSTDSRLLTGVIGRTGSPGYEEAVAVYERSSGKRLYTFQTGRVGGMLFTPDGRMLLVVTPGAIQFWDLATGSQVHAWKNSNASWFWDTDPKRRPAMGFSPDGNRFAIGMPEGDMLVFQVPAPDESGSSLSQSDLQNSWRDLISDNPSCACRAGHRLTAHPIQTVAFLREQLPRELASARAVIPQLLNDLDAKRVRGPRHCHQSGWLDSGRWGILSFCSALG